MDPAGMLRLFFCFSFVVFIVVVIFVIVDLQNIFICYILGGYRNYRTKLREHPAGKPCIPYFALCLRDLTYIR